MSRLRCEARQPQGKDLRALRVAGTWAPDEQGASKMLYTPDPGDRAESL
eukprot:CAMPEP_0176241664 /NCGR_PEP_ID=MMETSP0121_2-20121125/30010_1 /TAXON_ID=160619 /ORGANISM="Kryptoperidinium foliaceum, Strain CCMP 1326" /LENGTH=48 /DNA_ID= /DNA_START= /DNA_END= /DNA_ORIENTATION=